MHGPRLSIRYKMLLVIAGVLLVAMGTYLYLASSLFTQDKLAYIYDLNASLVSSLTEQTRSSLDVLIKELNVFAHEQSRGSAATDLFGREPDLLRVEIYAREGGQWRVEASHINREALDLLQLREDDLAQLRQARPLPVTALAQGSGYVYVQNSSLPPDAAVLTLAYRAAADTVIA